MSVLTIAMNTFRESIRNRVMINILLFAVGLILLSIVLGEWSLGEQIKVIKDFGLSAMSIFGLLIAIFIGIRLMVQELEQRTIYLIASKPIRRWEIVLGKYSGLALTLIVNVILMAVTLLVVNLIIEGRIDLGLLPAVFLIYIEILLIVAFALFFSSLMSPQLSALATLILYMLGHLTNFLYEYIRVFPDKGFHWLLKGIYYIVPNLEKLNLKMAVVDHVPQPPHVVAWATAYGLCYIVIVLILTAAVFNKKDLK
ncbi:ABC transporter permease subunit [bacterium]|nr:ABC transporter permease subunit [bacterium]